MSSKIRRTSANTCFTTRMQPSFFARTCGTRKTWTAYSRVGIRKRSATTPKPGRTSKAKHVAARTLRMSLAHPFEKERPARCGNDYHQDLTLQHPRCVYQVLKRHFSRYTPEMVEQACGVPPDLFLNLAETFCSASGPDKTASICYALGWTQHSKGSQLIRTAAILQLLLGNIGRPGGGILALRGHASIQGSTDIPTLFDLLPGYLPMPLFKEDSEDLRGYIEKRGAKTGWWANFDKYIVSLLKAYYGDAATAENDYGFRWLPRLTGDHSHMAYWLEMLDGKMEGLFVMGDNPAVAGPNSGLERRALAKLKWLVVRDLVEIETASFWYDSPEVKRGELKPEDIQTEVFLMPAAGHVEKEGTFTNTQRLLQFREKAVDPPGDVAYRALVPAPPRPAAQGEGQERSASSQRRVECLDLGLFNESSSADIRIEEVLQEINGWTLPDKTLVPGFAALKNDGSTACGCWIYSGVFPRPAKIGQRNTKLAASMVRVGDSPGLLIAALSTIVLPPARTARHGASVRSWCGGMTPRKSGPDWIRRTSPRPSRQTTRHRRTLKAMRLLPAISPSSCIRMVSGGFGFPSGLNDGPLPTHYEPWESPVQNLLYPRQANNPVALKRERPGNYYAQPAGRAISLRSDNLPSDGAPHLRSNEPLPFTPGGTAAGVVLRNLARVGG